MFRPNWPSSSVQVLCLRDLLFHSTCIKCCRLLSCWYRAVAMHPFGLWFCRLLGGRTSTEVAHRRQRRNKKLGRCTFIIQVGTSRTYLLSFILLLSFETELVRVLGYRSGGPSSIPGTTRKEKQWVWNGVHSASWVQLRSYLIEK
jgi:hypothetical protein